MIQNITQKQAIITLLVGGGTYAIFRKNKYALIITGVAAITAAIITSGDKVSPVLINL